MQLPPDEIMLFSKLWFELLSYMSKQYPAILGQAKTPEEIRQTGLEALMPLRDKLYEEPQVIAAFVRENPYGLTTEDLDIVSEWRNFVKGEFIILRQLKSYAIFTDVTKAPKAYGVLALNMSFESMADFPALVETVILPFRRRIVYDGVLLISNMSFGRGMRDNFTSDYERAKSMYGLITSLPFVPQKTEQSDEQMLRFYLKSERNREEHWDDIWDLIHQNPALLPLYHQEYGKRSARAF
jgi:hypothetical protein